MYNKTFGSHPNCSYIYAYGVCITDMLCRQVWKISRENQCNFVINTPDCRYEHAWMDYLVEFFCKFNNYEGQVYVGLVIVILEMILLFILLGTTAENFFAPTLCYISNVLGLSENLAGVTLLAFGNAAADIMTAVAGATILGPELVVGQLIGAGIFVTTLVASSILIQSSFYANPSYFLRDTIFYLVAISWMLYCTSRSFLCTPETVALIVLYFIYVAVVAFDAVYTKRKNKSISKKVTTLLEKERSDMLVEALTLEEALEEEDDQWSASSRRDSQVFLPPPIREPSVISADLVLPPMQAPRRRAVAHREAISMQAMIAERLNLLNAAGQMEVLERERMGNADVVAVKVEGELAFKKDTGVWEDFFNEMIPIDDDDWNSSGAMSRLVIILKAPIIYVLRYFIPVVDQGALNNGWCKLLNTMHCVISPVFLCVSMRLLHAEVIVAAPVGASILAVCLTCACLVFWKSQVNQAPWFHMIFAVLGFLTSLDVIHLIAHELVTLIKVLGTQLNINISTLAMTFLAYGNSMGDIVSNSAMARNGYARMAWAACFGSPLLSTLLGGGLALTVLIEITGKDHCLVYDRVYGKDISNCFLFLELSLLSSLVIIPLMNFQCRRSYALYLIGLYVMFFIFVMCCEWGLTHPFGL